MIYDNFLQLDDIGANGSFNPLINNPVEYLKADYGIYSDGAVQFTGTDKASLTIADAAQTGLDPLTNDFSVNMWVYVDSLGTNLSMMTKGGTSGAATGYWMRRLIANTVRFYFGDGSATEKVVTSTSTLSASTWTNICITCSRAGLMSIYWNGNITPENTVDISSQQGSVNSGGNFFLGQNVDGTDNFFNGRMDSVGIWNKALSTAEVTSLYNSGSGKMYDDLTAGEKTSLVAWYGMNEENGIRYDQTGNNHLQQTFTEMVTNGTFTGNDTGWTPGAGWAYGSNTEIATAATADLTQSTVVPTIGKKYKVTATYVVTTGSVAFTLGGVTGATRSASGTYTSYITATSAATLEIHPVSAFTGTVDNVSVTCTEIQSAAGIASGLSIDGNLCASFDGSTQYLTKTSNASLQTGDIDFTAFGWFNTTSIPVTLAYVCGKYGATSNKREWGIYQNTNGTISFVCSPDGTATGTGTINSSPIIPQPNAWYFVVAKHDSVNNKLKMKINNVSITDVDYSSGITAFDSSFQIGARGDNATPFGGRIDGVGFIKRITTDAEDTTMFNVGKGVKYAGLPATMSDIISFWNLDVYSAGTGLVTRTDSTANANNLTDTGNTPSGQGVNYFEGAVAKWLDSSVNANNFTQTTQANKLLYRINTQNGLPVLTGDGLTKRLSNAADKIGTGDITFACVFSPRDLGGTLTGRIIDNGKFIIRLSAVGRLVVLSDGVTFAVSATPSIVLGTWYVAIITRTSAGVVNIYLNGTLNGNVDQASGTPAAGSPTYLLNSAAGTSGFDGDIAEIQVISSILSVGQITQLSNYLKSKWNI